MAKVTTAYRPDGSTRSIWNDQWHGAVGHDGEIRRASRVELIKTGRSRGRYFVDFSEMGEGWQFCLPGTFPTHAEAVAAEQAYLIQNWVLR